MYICTWLRHDTGRFTNMDMHMILQHERLQETTRAQSQYKDRLFMYGISIIKINGREKSYLYVMGISTLVGRRLYMRRFPGVMLGSAFNTLRPRQNELHFAGDIFKCIFLNENVWIPVKISLKYVPKGPINNIPALVRIMAWRRSGDKPLSEPMMVSLPTHICVARPQWVKSTTRVILLKAIPFGSV